MRWGKERTWQPYQECLVLKAGQAWRSLLEGHSTVVSLPSWVAEAEHWGLYHEEVPWEQLVLRKVLADRILKSAEAGILGARKLA